MRPLYTTALIGMSVLALCLPAFVGAVPNASVAFELYHYEGGGWQQYLQGDPFPADGHLPGTNLWKYTYVVRNHGFSGGIYQVYVFFNSDNVLRATYSSGAAPTGWTATYFAPSVGNNNWKERFRTFQQAYFVALGDSLSGFEVEFTWEDTLLPGPQNYDAISTAGSEPGVTEELLPALPIEGTTWGRIKQFYEADE
jgi:hypothetical protein